MSICIIGGFLVFLDHILIEYFYFFVLFINFDADLIFRPANFNEALKFLYSSISQQKQIVKVQYLNLWFVL